MKITASRRDDILREKEAYERKFKIRLDRHQSQRRAWHNAKQNAFKPIKDYILGELENFSSLDFEVSIDENDSRSPGVKVSVTCNERRVFDEASALSWNYKAFLDKDGNVVKESSSWSGLSATTEEQMQSLRDTLGALEFLNSADWPTLLNQEVPNYDEYVTEEDPRFSRSRNFDLELMEADIEPFIGTNTWIKGNPGHHPTNYLVLSETPKYYTVVPLDNSYFDESGKAFIHHIEDDPKRYSERMRKDRFYMLVGPEIETMEV